MTLQHFLRIVSVFSILLPIVIGVINFKTAGFPFRLFLFFLLVGFAVDMSMYFLSLADRQMYLPYLFTFYSLVEATFFYWFLSQYAGNKVIKLIALWMTFITPVFWLLLKLLVRYEMIEPATGQIFDSVYEVMVSFLAGLTLLSIAEQQDNIVSFPPFWILMAFFFYCFCTFFIMGFLHTYLAQQIWFLNNIINILTYGFYSMGLWTAGKHQIHTQR